MRPLMIQVPRGDGKDILERAKQLQGKNLSLLQGYDDNKEIDIIFASISNRKVEAFISEADKFEGAHITLLPQGVMALYPPNDQAPDQVTDIETRSPIEIFLSGLQSIGSWKGFIGYAIITSFVVWTGLFTDTSYLLVAAMLIAPFAGPAMNTAIATARGDWPLLKQGMLRYFVSIIITISGVCLLSLLMDQKIATPLMIENSQVSSAAILLALSAGAAGALNLVQSERDSLVSGAAVGMLVAASLAPPAGVVGMAVAIGEWGMAKSGIFLLFLQLIGINITGSLVFRFFGLTPEGPRYNRGRQSIYLTSLFLTIILSGFILFLQLNSSPDLQRSSRAQRANAEVQEIVKNDNRVNLIEANVRFTRTGAGGQNPLLCLIYVQRNKVKETSDSRDIKRELTRSIQEGLINAGFNLTPLVEVTVIDPP